MRGCVGASARPLPDDLMSNAQCQFHRRPGGSQTSLILSDTPLRYPPQTHLPPYRISHALPSRSTLAALRPPPTQHADQPPTRPPGMARAAGRSYLVSTRYSCTVSPARPTYHRCGREPACSSVGRSAHSRARRTSWWTCCRTSQGVSRREKGIGERCGHRRNRPSPGRIVWCGPIRWDIAAYRPAPGQWERGNTVNTVHGALSTSSGQ